MDYGVLGVYGQCLRWAMPLAFLHRLGFQALFQNAIKVLAEVRSGSLFMLLLLPKTIW